MTLDELVADYLNPLRILIFESECEGTFFQNDAHWFAEHPDRKLLLRMAYSKEYSHDWYELYSGAFGDGSPGLSDNMLAVLAREPKRVVAVLRRNKQHQKCVVWLGPVVWTCAREWNSTKAVACDSDAAARMLISECVSKGFGDEIYSQAWLAEFSAALKAEPVMQARQAWQQVPQNAKAN